VHPDIQRDIDQRAIAGLITLMDAKILYKYLAERQTIRELELDSLLSEFTFMIASIAFFELREPVTARTMETKKIQIKSGKG
jgi:hypothetical protein